MQWHTQFCGIEMAHNYFVYHLMSVHTASVPVRAIVELGTGRGALTTYCGLLGLRYGIPVYSYDWHSHYTEDTARLLRRLDVQLRQADIFSSVAEISELLSAGPTYLICDNGNKPREFRTFVPMLTPGSLVSVHDYSSEFRDADAEGFAVEPIRPEEWLQHNVQFATWRVPG